jgi:predicted transcriptional regulator
MTKNVVTARNADTSERLLSEMTVHRFRHMPVVETGRLIGLISIGDLVKIQLADMEMEPRRGSTRAIKQLFRGTRSESGQKTKPQFLTNHPDQSLQVGA